MNRFVFLPIFGFARLGAFPRVSAQCNPRLYVRFFRSEGAFFCSCLPSRVALRWRKLGDYLPDRHTFNTVLNRGKLHVT